MWILSSSNKIISFLSLKGPCSWHTRHQILRTRENLLPQRDKQVTASGPGKDSNGWLAQSTLKGFNNRKAKKGVSIPTYLQMAALAVSDWLGGKQRKWGEFYSCSPGPFYEVGCLWSRAWWVERQNQDDQSETLWDSMLFIGFSFHPNTATEEEIFEFSLC